MTNSGIKEININKNNSCPFREPYTIWGFLAFSRVSEVVLVVRKKKKKHLPILDRHKRCRLDPCIRKIPWKRAWQPTPVFLPGESHGQRSLVDYSPQGHKESDTTETT